MGQPCSAEAIAPPLEVNQAIPESRPAPAPEHVEVKVEAVITKPVQNITAVEQKDIHPSVPKADEPAPVKEEPTVSVPEPAAELKPPAPSVKFEEEPANPVTQEPAILTEDSQQLRYADMPKEEEEDLATNKRETLAGDEHRILVEIDDGSEPPIVQSALSNLSLAVEVLKARIAVADATSATIKGYMKQIKAKYYWDSSYLDASTGA